jgi:hypothetical protein
MGAIAAAASGYLWSNHLDAWSSTALHCMDVDPFRCHDSADKAVTELRDILPSVRHRGLDRVIEVAVQNDEAALLGCDGHPGCPPSASEYLARVSYLDVVTIHHGILFDEVRVARCKNGDYRVMVSNLPIYLPLSRSLC